MTDHKFKEIRRGCVMLPGTARTDKGYNFTVEASEGSTVSLLLYKKRSGTPVCEIPYEESFCSGRIYSMFIEDFPAEDYEYNYRINGTVCQDPGAYAILGTEKFGAPADEDEHRVRCGFLQEGSYDWGEDGKTPKVPYEDMVLYKLHVRGFTKLWKCDVKKRGTFAGLQEMIPYFKELGVNALELMPAYEFRETQPFCAAGGYISEKRALEKVNYWGYIPGYYFAPKRSYCATAEPQREVRDLIKALHSAGIQCIMEFCFQKETQPLTALHALRFWKSFYHVDGFRIMGDGLLTELAVRDAFLADAKLLVDGWDFSRGDASGNRNLAECSMGFFKDMRRFLKSDEDTLEAAAYHIRCNADDHGIINFMTCQDGFTMNDLVSYNYKHNEANGEDNRDGGSYNYSWNCGVEGPSRRLAVRQMRRRQMRNAFLMMLLSQGVPMLYAGDEIANSQEGNNNVYCQDNPTGWVDWRGLKKNQELLCFVKQAVAFRQDHPILHMQKKLHGVDYLTKGFPDISFHGERAWYCSYDNTSRLLGIMYCGAYAEKENGEPDDFIYVAYNFHWEAREAALPNLPGGKKWRKAADTGDMSGEPVFRDYGEEYTKTIGIGPRTIIVLLGE